jgi:hypothetical protein
VNGDQTYEVLLNSVQIGLHSTTSGENFTLRTIGVNFLATNTLTFEGMTTTSTWAMMIFGFFGVGVVAYRRKGTRPAFRLA